MIFPEEGCPHLVVSYRNTDGAHHCDACNARFFHLDMSANQGKIRIAEPYATLRDQFAMAAMTGMLGHHDLHSTIRNYPSVDDWRKNIAEASYRCADAMMKAREQ